MMSLAHVSDKYPQGNTRMLISSLFNLEINIGTDPLSIGYAVIDAELCVKAFEALANGSPATYSFLTLNEEDIFVSHDICAPHGSSVTDILLHFGIEPESVFLIMKNGKAGGKYISLTDNIGTDTHSLTLFGKSEERRTEECIGCGRCNDVCPSKILPSLIYEYGEAGSLQTCAKLNVLCCIDCFCCNEVCPSGIPLAESMLEIKKRLEPCGEVSK